MSYTQTNGKFANTQDVNLASTLGASITLDAVSPVIELGDRAALRLRLNVTANAATSLDVTIQGSRDGVNNWYTLGTFASVTTPAAESKTFPCDRFVRASYNHTGAGDIVSTLTGEAA